MVSFLCSSRLIVKITVFHGWNLLNREVLHRKEWQQSLVRVLFREWLSPLVQESCELRSCCGKVVTRLLSSPSGSSLSLRWTHWISKIMHGFSFPWMCLIQKKNFFILRNIYIYICTTYEVLSKRFRRIWLYKLTPANVKTLLSSLKSSYIYSPINYEMNMLNLNSEMFWIVHMVFNV